MLFKTKNPWFHGTNEKAAWRKLPPLPHLPVILLLSQHSITVVVDLARWGLVVFPA